MQVSRRNLMVAGGTTAATTALLQQPSWSNQPGEPLPPGTLSAIPPEQRAKKIAVPATPEWFQQGISQRTRLSMNLFEGREVQQPKTALPVRPYGHQDVYLCIEDGYGRLRYNRNVRIPLASRDALVTPWDVVWAASRHMKGFRFYGDQDGALLAQIFGWRNANAVPRASDPSQIREDCYFFLFIGPSEVALTGPKTYNIAHVPGLAIADRPHFLTSRSDGFTTTNLTNLPLPILTTVSPAIQVVLNKRYPYGVPPLLTIGYGPRTQFAKP